MSLIYLASPYAHESPEVMQTRYEMACEYTAKLKRAGLYVFSPTAHGHGPAQYGLPKDYAYWERYCEIMLPKCDIMLVLMIDGYGESREVGAEVDLADKLGMPVWYAEFNEVPVFQFW